MIFDPSKEQVRHLFIGAWEKHRTQQTLTPLETIAAGIVLEHPEYHTLLMSPDVMTREFLPERDKANPFLHLSLHLAIEEQLSIDQPAGILYAFEALLSAHGGRHHAMHEVLECLNEVIFNTIRYNSSPDSHAYLNAVRHRAGLPQLND